jgi:hypothetical protein
MLWSLPQAMFSAITKKKLRYKYRSLIQTFDAKGREGKEEGGAEPDRTIGEGRLNRC